MRRLFLVLSLFAGHQLTAQELRENVRIAVLPPQADANDPLPANAVRDRFISYLVSTPSIQVIDQERTTAVLKELAKAQLGFSDPAAAPQIGRMLGAEKLAWIKVSGKVLTAGLTDVESGKVDFSESSSLEKSDGVFKDFVDHIQHAILLNNLSRLSPASSTLKVALSSSKKGYREDENIEFSVSVSEDCYLYLLLVQSDSATTVLFPNIDQPDNRVRAGVVKIPDGRSGFVFAAGPPFGRDYVKVIASRRKLDLFPLKRIEGTPFSRVDGMPGDVPRGIKRITTGIPSGEWNAAEIGLDIVDGR